MRLLTPFMQRPDAGALPTLRAATDPGVRGGQYDGPSGLGEPAAIPSSSTPALTPTTRTCRPGCGQCRRS